MREMPNSEQKGYHELIKPLIRKKTLAAGTISASPKNRIFNHLQNKT